MKDAHHRGSVTVEMVILTPVFVMLTLFIVYLGRMTSTQQRLIQAADSAARAASITLSLSGGPKRAMFSATVPSNSSISWGR